jgi:hypothetical protein
MGLGTLELMCGGSVDQPFNVMRNITGPLIMLALPAGVDFTLMGDLHKDTGTGTGNFALQSHSDMGAALTGSGSVTVKKTK